MKEKLFFVIALMFGFVLLLGSLSWINVQVIPRVDISGEHFLSPWTSARTFLFDGENPYLPSLAQRVQVSIYGRHAQEGEYLYGLEIPFYKLFFYFPFAFISKFEVALAVWMGVAQIALLFIGFLSIDLAQWRPSVFVNILFFLTLFFSFFGFYPVIGGSGVIFGSLILLLILFAIREEKDEILGIALVFGTFFPEKGGGLFLLLLLWTLQKKRFRAISFSVMSLIILFVVSFLVYPGWFRSYIDALSENFHVRYGFLFSDFLWSLSLMSTDVWTEIVRWVTVMAILIAWIIARKGDFRHLLWTSAFTVSLIPFLNIPVSPYFYSIMLFPLPLIFRIAEDRWSQVAQWLVILFLLSLLSTWFFLRLENSLQFLTFLYPALLSFSLVWMRWWYLRAPHTWFDEAKKYQSQ